jgi:phosphatidylglycerophosphate synthase
MLDGRPERAARHVPRLLSASRIVLAAVFVLAIEISASLPLLVALLAAATDFADGRLARRLGTASRAGAVIDVVADGVFVLAALSALAAMALLSWLLPLAVVAALSGFALAMLRGRDGRAARVRSAADRAGHTAGIANYAVVIAASAALAGWVSASWLMPVSVAVAVLNLSPLLLRATRRARA